MTPIASTVAGIATHVTCSGPISGRFTPMVRPAQTLSSPGQKKDAYCDNPDRARGDRQRSAERELPDKKKRYRPPQFLRPVNLFQVSIRPARPRHRRAQFRPHQAIASRQHRPQDPTQHRLRTAHHRDHQRDGDKRPHADHVDHVERGRRTQPNTAHQPRLRLRRRL